MTLALALLGDCAEPATETIVQLDTDVPPWLPLEVAVTVRSGTSVGDSGAMYRWTRGDDAGQIHLPATFAIVPGPRLPDDATVTLEIDATVGPVSPGGPVGTIQHEARFAFQPHRVNYLPVFLSLLCTAPTTGCTTVSASQCTVSVLCTERQQTCDRGQCVRLDVLPTQDAGIDAHDTAGPTDDAVCVTNCSGRVCGPDPACGRSCGTCPSGEQCDLTGNCVCPSGQTLCGRACTDTQSDSANCGRCGTACPAAVRCISGQCECPNGESLCGASCVNLQTDAANCGSCNNTCPAGQPCASGACVCTTVTNACASNSACCSGLVCLPYVSGGADYCCHNRGASCANAADCCGQLLCKSGSCACEPTNVSPEPSCATGSDCCSGICNGGTCACKQAGDTCVAATECCYQRSCRAYATGGQKYCCREAGAGCSSTSQCCGQMYCTNGTCHCRPVGSSCAASADCCSGHTCNSGTCS